MSRNYQNTEEFRREGERIADRADRARSLADFVAKPQVWCEKCRLWNEADPPSWWRGNCWHAPSPPGGAEG